MTSEKYYLKKASHSLFRRLLALMGSYLVASFFLKPYGVNPEYIIIIFFISLLLIAISRTPYKETGTAPEWLMFSGLTLTALSGGATFTLALVFNYPSDSLLIFYGAITFFIGIVLTMISIMAIK